MLKIRGALEGDLKYLAGNLRAADVREAVALMGHTDIEGALRGSLGPFTRVVEANGRAELIFGVRGISLDGAALIWAAGTPEVVKHRRAFLTLAPAVLKDWLTHFDYLFNFSHADNHEHHRWLRWCGAETLPSVPWGALGDDFVPFIIRRPKACA